MLAVRTPFDGGAGQRLTFMGADGAPCTLADLFADWRGACRFAPLLAAAPYAAFTWEMPAFYPSRCDVEAECVVIDAPALAVAADAGSFADKFAADPADIIEFPNLAGDAHLIAPAARGATPAYAHIAAFVRQAPAPQVAACFARLAEAACVARPPVWISTSGFGVPWVHCRVDRMPKYYRYAPYRHGSSAC